MTAAKPCDRKKRKQLNIGMPAVGMGNRVKAQVIERRPGHPDEGKVIHETGWTQNLILDAGMDRLPTTKICDLFTHAVAGTGNTPTSDDSGAVTATTSGTTCTSSGAFFAAGDVGKLLRFDTGEKAMITAFTSTTQVTLASSLGVTAQLFTLYRVGQTSLATEVKRSNTYLTGTGNTETTRSGSTFTHRRTYDFSVETGNVNYSEIGFSHTGTVAANINTRALFSGGAVTVLTGQQLRVIYDFLVTVSPTTSTAVEPTITGWPSLSQSVTADSTTDKITLASHGFSADQKVVLSGTTPPGGLSFATTYYVITDTSSTFKLAATPGGGAIDITSNGTAVTLVTSTQAHAQMTKIGLSGINTSTGATQAQDTTGGGDNYCNEPVATSCGMAIGTESTALPTWPDSSAVTITVPTGGTKGSGSLTISPAYVNGSFSLTRTATYATTEGNSSAIRTLSLIVSTFNSRAGLVTRFDTLQEKTSSFTLTINWTWTWDRVFT